MVELRPVSRNRDRFLPLLLEADAVETIVRSYMYDGVLFAIAEDGVEIGVALIVTHDDDAHARELKNLAVAPSHRDRGLGGEAVAALAERLRAEGVTRLVVGTAETSADALRFYRRCGFREFGRRVGFFDTYPEPVVEGGIVAHDMVMLQMDLSA